LAVARFSPEKGLHDLIRAFRNHLGTERLVIAGDCDYNSVYARRIRKMAAEDPRIVLTGYLNAAELAELYSGARLFVLPSHNEGQSLALLEALAFRAPILASDIPSNLEVGLPRARYYRCGDVADLASLKVAER